MSQVRTTTSMVTNPAYLERACQRARDAGIAVVGPRYEANYPGRRSGQKLSAYFVQLPDNVGGRSVVFFCNENGEIQRDTDANYGGSEKAFQRLLSEYSAAAAEELAAELNGHLQVTVAQDEIELEMEIVY